MLLAESTPFSLEERLKALAALPEKPAVFGLFGSDPQAQPFLGKTPNLRRRLARFLSVKQGSHGRRLELASRILRIEWSVTGSDFESQLKLYEAERAIFGAQANERMHLRAPAFLRLTVKNPFPRVAVTTSVSRGAAQWLYGPFPSRAAAERYSDEMLNLFQLRRCVEDLDPNPSYPGCPYGEMKMCLEPCKMAVSNLRYAEETAAVKDFLSTQGQAMITRLSAERDEASASLEFETAAAIHSKLKKVEVVRSLAGEIVRPLSQLKALVLQCSGEESSVALFLMDRGELKGPATFSTLGMRLANEHSGSSSLFSQPVMLSAVPLIEEGGEKAPAYLSKDALDERLSKAISALESVQSEVPSDSIAAHLCFFSRWYYRPEKKRVGEVFFYDTEEGWPRKAILRGISRVFLSSQRGIAPQTATLNPQEDTK